MNRFRLAASRHQAGSSGPGSLDPALLSVLAGLFMVMAVMPSVAQTPDAACSADSLYLISPDQVSFRLATAGKPGLTISWPNLNLNEATCYSLDGTAGLGFGVTVDGGYGDKVDRVFLFTTPDAGAVGGPNPGNIMFTWRTAGQSNNGSIGGAINLSNNGGVWDYSRSGSAWSQSNNGLPMTWERTNVMALDRGAGSFMVASFSRGVTLESESGGLFSYNGTNWTRLAPEVFSRDVRITAVAVSAADNNRFAVGTATRGLFVTTDGGATFTQWRSELDPAAPTTSYPVSALDWSSNRLLVFIRGWGMFISSNGGTGFSRSPIMVPSTLDVVPPPKMEVPAVMDFSVDPANPDRIVAGLLSHGAYETTDGGASWHNLYGNLIVRDPEDIGAWEHSALDVVIDAANPQVIVMGVSQKGLYRTADGGATWSLVGDAQQPSNRGSLVNYSLIARPGLPGEILAMENGWKLLHSLDSGATWSDFAQQPLLNRALVVVPHRDASGDFTLATNGGGIYRAGIPLPLKDTYTSATTASLQNLDLGLSVTFAEGTVNPADQFELVTQTFQGWAVWRGLSHQPDDMTLIGLYDKVNPEDCYRGYCGDNSLEIVPQCFRAKRAACFDLSSPDTLRFFDEEVYNGFSYVYAVSSFDYGNTALTTPQNNTNEMLYSPRWTGDPLSPFTGAGTRQRFDVNAPAAAPLRDEEIYAYPNPLRLGAGVPGGEGRRVVFTNLPEGSRVRLFTTAGDDVIELAPESQTGGQIYWSTVNRNGEDVAPGVYLYKVEMPAREDYWGRIVVIR